jgi:hypothetical protein
MSLTIKPMTLTFKKHNEEKWVRELTNDTGAVVWVGNPEFAPESSVILFDWARQMKGLPFFNIVAIKSDYFDLTDADFAEILA